MTTYLLDINVLLALVDPLHTHHESAHGWFQREGHRSWATCPITENGFVRISSHPGYPNRPGDAPVALEVLRQMCSSSSHRFWHDSISLRSVLGSQLAFTHRMTTDLYLLAVAVEHLGRLATFDQRIPASLIKGGREALELLPFDEPQVL